MKTTICPYKAENNKTCSHKGCKPNKGNQRKCGFKHHYNCELFRNWLALSEKSKFKGGKPQIEVSEG